jgi:hypothetical protein
MMTSDTKSAPRISLLTALPHSEADLISAQGMVSKDYVNSKLLGMYSPNEAWARIGPVLGDAASDLLAWCRLKEIPVYRRAGISELEKAAADSDVIILLAHWKGPMVRSTDFLAGVSHVMDAISDCNGSRVFDGHNTWSRPEADLTEDQRKAELAQILNHRIKNWPDWMDLDGYGSSKMIIGQYYAECVARERLDSMLKGVLLSGARLELHDGLWSPASVASCFPRDWDGICDFVCCRSIYLSEVTKERNRCGLFRADAKFLQPENVIRVVRRVLSLVIEQHADYIEAVCRVSSQQEKIP